MAYHSLKMHAIQILMWCAQNRMQVNADKFQLILFGREELAGSLNIIGGTCTAINSEIVVKNHRRFLSIELCQKGGMYINVLSRLTNQLTTEVRLLLFRSFIFSHVVFLYGILWIMNTILY